MSNTGSDWWAEQLRSVDRRAWAIRVVGVGIASWLLALSLILVPSEVRDEAGNREYTSSVSQFVHVLGGFFVITLVAICGTLGAASDREVRNSLAAIPTVMLATQIAELSLEARGDLAPRTGSTCLFQYFILMICLVFVSDMIRMRMLWQRLGLEADGARTTLLRWATEHDLELVQLRPITSRIPEQMFFRFEVRKPDTLAEHRGWVRFARGDDGRLLRSPSDASYIIDAVEFDSAGESGSPFEPQPSRETGRPMTVTYPIRSLAWQGSIPLSRSVRTAKLFWEAGVVTTSMLVVGSCLLGIRSTFDQSGLAIFLLSVLVCWASGILLLPWLILQGGPKLLRRSSGIDLEQARRVAEEVCRRHRWRCDEFRWETNSIQMFKGLLVVVRFYDLQLLFPRAGWLVLAVDAEGRPVYDPALAAIIDDKGIVHTIRTPSLEPIGDLADEIDEAGSAPA